MEQWNASETHNLPVLLKFCGRSCEDVRIIPNNLCRMISCKKQCSLRRGGDEHHQLHLSNPIVRQKVHIKEMFVGSYLRSFTVQSNMSQARETLKDVLITELVRYVARSHFSN